MAARHIGTLAHWPTHQLIKERVVDHPNDGYPSHGKTDRGAAHGVTVNLVISKQSTRTS
jgi:hypothetical protein